MDTRYRRYNEKTFEVYCKTSICNAIRKGRKEKQKRAEREIPLSAASDETLFKLCKDLKPTETAVRETVPFYVRGRRVDVADIELGQALAYLTPQKREILLMSYYWDMRDVEIAELLGVGKSTVQWWRTTAVKRLRELLGERT